VGRVDSNWISLEELIAEMLFNGSFILLEIFNFADNTIKLVLEETIISLTKLIIKNISNT